MLVLPGASANFAYEYLFQLDEFDTKKNQTQRKTYLKYNAFKLCQKWIK